MKFAIWAGVDPAHKEQFFSNFEKAYDAGIRTILPCFYNTREALFKSKVTHSSKDVFNEFVEPLRKKKDLKIYAWTMMMRYTAEDAQKKAHWFSVNQLGQSSLTHPQYVDYYKWLSPFEQQVTQYLTALVAEIAELDVDGVHLDYIRYCDRHLPRGLLPLYNLTESEIVKPEFDYDYQPLALAAFEKKFGYSIKEIRKPAEQLDWLKFRLDAITNIVEQCASITKEHGKNFSAAVFPNPLTAPNMVGQNWGAWSLDSAYPMIYHKFYNKDFHWVAQEARICRDTARAKEIIPGIYLPDFTHADELQLCLDELKNDGFNSVALFDLNALTPELTQVIQKNS